MTKTPNIAASVRARLSNVNHARKADFQLTLQRFVAERFVYRLGVSRHRENFVMKGAMLFVLWDESIFRPTRDLDLAGYWPNDAESLADGLREICLTPYPQDGLVFAIETLELQPIRDATEYHGFRARMNVALEKASIPFQIDIGFGDEVVPSPVDVRYPVLIDIDAPWIRAYPREAMLAEKLHAMATHGILNSRYKDFFDVWTLAARFDFEGSDLTASIATTFRRRASHSIADWPVALTKSFYMDAARQLSWSNYLRRSGLTTAPTDFSLVGERVLEFLAPVFRAAASGMQFDSMWKAGGPWSA